MVNVSYYIQNLPNVNGDNVTKLDSHLAQVPIMFTTMDVDPKTKQANFIRMSSFLGKLGNWATKVLYNLHFVSQLVEFVRIGFVVKDY